MYVLSSSEIAYEEKRLFSMGQTPLALMSVVGMVTSLRFVKDFPHAKKVVAVCGKGNNAGDSLALLYNLKLKGYECAIYQPWGAATEECRIQRELCRSLGIEETSDLSDYDVIIEGILGVGFEGILREETKKLITRLNSIGKPIIAIDIPAGLNADTGEPQPEAIKATYTYSVGFFKRGFLLQNASKYTGKVVVVDIGFPPPENGLKIFTSRDAISLFRVKDDFIHKVQNGTLLVWAGSKQYPGSVRLCLEGALNMGVGMSFCASEVCYTVLPQETIPIPEENLINGLVDESILKKLRALAIGPGLTREKSEQIKSVIAKSTLPMILDAGVFFDGLLDSIGNKNVVLTPHDGEFERIFKYDADRIERFEAFLEKYPHITLVLKGPNTLVGRDKKKYVVPIADADLAVAGSGDVLCGMIGALIATGHDTLDAALLGVFTHAVIPETARQNKMSIKRAGDIANLLKTFGSFERIISECKFI